MKIDKNEPVWYQRYRPSTVEDCILPDRIKNTFRNIAEEGVLNQSMVLIGTKGTGKTSVGKALVNDINAKMMFINGSEDSGIDVLRNRIRNFASTVSLDNQQKIVFIDEAEYLNKESTQPALRGFIEEFSKNTQFILTCNYKNKLIPELVDSRFGVVSFSYSEQEIQYIGKYFFERVIKIFEQEGVVYEKAAVAKLIMKYAPDMRKIWNELQLYNTQEGHIDLGILSIDNSDNIDELIEIVKAKKFKPMLEWIEKTSRSDDPMIITNILEALEPNLDSMNKATAILSAAEWQYKTHFSVNKKLALTAFLIEIMAQCI